MRNFPRDSEDSLRSAELVAYVDGELAPRAVEQIEEALALCPEAQALVEDHRYILQSLRESPVPEPAAEVWDRMLRQVQSAALPATRTVPARRSWRAGISAAAAAVLLVALPGDLALRPDAPASAEVAPLPVATAHDVEIVSIDGADLRALLVGHPPLRGALELAGAGDVLLHFTESGEHNWVTAMEQQEGLTPIFMVPMRTAGSEKP